MVFNKKFSGLMGAKNDALVLPQLPCIKKTSDKDTFVQIEIPTCVGEPAATANSVEESQVYPHVCGGTPVIK